jgi:hypothetical protein
MTHKPVLVVLLCFHTILTTAQPPGDTSVRLYGKGRISTPLDELNAAILPGGKTIFFTVTVPKNKVAVIMESHFKRGKWSRPKKASFSTGKDRDYDPYCSTDGSRLYFISDRLNDSSGTKNNFDIYVSQRHIEGWTDPIPLSSSINDSNNQYYPALAANGNLYYSTRTGSGYDIFCSPYQQGSYKQSFSLKGDLNSGHDEVDVSIAPDESFMILTIYGRGDSKGNGDLYISFRNEEVWLAPLPLEGGINTESREYCPMLIGNTLYFTSTKGLLDNEQWVRIEQYSDIRRLMKKTLNGLGNVYATKFDQQTINYYKSKLHQSIDSSKSPSL